MARVSREFGNTVFDRFSALEAMIGNTPMLALYFRIDGFQQHTIYAKAEFLNLTGSIKDRMALHVLKAAYQDGKIRMGDSIAEATSGNSGISFAALGCALGHRVEIFMPDWMSPERRSLIRSFGASIVPVSKEQGGFLGSIEQCEKLARSSPGIFLPSQFCNAANVQAHSLTTGPEIVAQLERNGGQRVDAFVAGVGTGGTVMGVGRYLKGIFPNVKVHPIEPAESPTLTAGIRIGEHRIQGISDEFVPPICDLKSLDSVLAIPDGDAILMAQKLAKVLGLGVGISSGANFLGAVRALEQLDGGAIVVTVFCDDNKKYLSTDLTREEPLRSGYLSPRIELMSYETLPRIR